MRQCEDSDVLRLAALLLLRLAVAALLVYWGVRAITRGGAGFVVLGVALELLALITLAMAALAGAALFGRSRQTAV